jgi:DNA-binding CsgD family transcriptional regulator
MYLKESRFDCVVKRFTEAVLVRELWPEVLHEIGEATGSLGASLIPFPSLDPVFPHSRGVAELVNAFVTGGWQARNTRSINGAALVERDPSLLRTFHTDGDLIEPEAMNRDPFYQDFLLPLGFSWFTGASLAEAGGRFIMFDLQRSARLDPYSREEIVRLNNLLLKLRKASVLALRVGLKADQRAVSLLDGLGCPAALLDSIGRLLGCNESFAAHLDDAVRIKLGRLVAADRDTDAHLQTLIRSNLRPSSSGATGPCRVPLRRKDRSPLIAEAMPVVGAAQDVFSFARVLLVLSDPDVAPNSDTALLQRVFGLTVAEAALAVRIGTGESLADAAADLGITVGTARTTLKSIFWKTDTHRQSGLVALLTRFRSRLRHTNA